MRLEATPAIVNEIPSLFFPRALQSRSFSHHRRVAVTRLSRRHGGPFRFFPPSPPYLPLPLAAQLFHRIMRTAVDLRARKYGDVRMASREDR